MTDTPEKFVQTIRRKTGKKHQPEEKIRIVLEGLRGKSRLLNSAEEKALPKASITAGARIT